MELTRRSGQGRLAEILGARAVGTDRFMRTLGLYRLAAAEAARLDPELAAVVGAYVSGINAYLNEAGTALPLEFAVLWFRPEPWTPADALVWQKLMGLQLSGNWNDELLRAQIVQKLGPARAAALFPDGSSDGEITLAGLPDFVGRLRTVMTAVVTPHLASNIWALAPSRTSTGGAILANDPHLNFGAPNLWYLVGLRYPGIELIGATVPGIPVHLLGHNGRLAWGFTTTHGDTQDLFIETQVDADTVVGQGGPEKLSIVDETISVRFGEPVTIRVRASPRGPIISDLLSESERNSFGADRLMSLSATLLQPDDGTLPAIYRMARAKTVDAFAAESTNFHAPQQNAMFADVDGGIGYAVVGRIPMRREPTCRGLLPTPAVDGRCDWIGWVPPAERPLRLNPADGVLINANNRIVPADYPHMIAAEWPSPDRAERIASTIIDRAGITPAETAALQLDQVSLAARRMTPVMLRTIEGVALTRPELMERLRSWDGASDRERVEPLLFNVWLAMLKQRLVADELGDVYDDFFGERSELIEAILTRDPSWCDDMTTPTPESCARQTSLAWSDAIAWIKQRAGQDATSWQWQNFHIAEFSHPIFANISPLARLGSFSIATGGDNSTINRGSPARLTSSRALRHRHGPGYRAIYDLADLSRSKFSLAGGQSGNVLSPHLDDLLADWRDGKYFALRAPAGSDSDAKRLVLNPAF